MRCKRGGFDPWVIKIPWRRAWQPTPVFLPGKSHAQRSLVGYSSCRRKELDTTERLSTHAHVCIYMSIIALSLHTYSHTHTHTHTHTHFTQFPKWILAINTFIHRTLHSTSMALKWPISPALFLAAFWFEVVLLMVYSYFFNENSKHSPRSLKVFVCFWKVHLSGDGSFLWIKPYILLISTSLVRSGCFSALRHKNERG